MAKDPSDSLHVLLIEDDHELRGSLAQALMVTGYEVTAVSDGMSALSQLEHPRQFSLMVTDVRLPGPMDGISFLQRARELSVDLPTIVITGYTSEDDPIRALKLGVCDYLCKPFLLETFLDSVARAAQRARQQDRDQRQSLLTIKSVGWLLEQMGNQGYECRLDSESLLQAQAVKKIVMELGWAQPAAELLYYATLFNHLQEQNIVPSEVALGLPSQIRSYLFARQDPELASCFDRASEGLEAGDRPSEEGDMEAQPRRRQLLALAHRFEATGDALAAEQAYREVASGPPGLEQVEAYLGLARASLRHGDPKLAADYYLKAHSLCRQMGPVCFAEYSIEIGLRLLTMASQEAVSLLESSSEILERLNFRFQAALARIAIRQSKNLLADLVTLDQDEFSAELRRYSFWLCHCLLSGELPVHPVVLALVAKLSVESPRFLLDVLKSSPGIANELKCRWVEVVKDRSILEFLAQDSDHSVGVRAQQRLRPDTESIIPRLDIVTLGRFEVYLGDSRLPDSVFSRNRKAPLFLVYLALNLGRAVPDETLIQEFWGEEELGGRENIYSVRAILRKALKVPGDRTELPYITRGLMGWQINPLVLCRLDVLDLRENIRLAYHYQKVEIGRSLAHFRKVASLYRGPFLEGVALEWIEQLRFQLQTEVGSALLHYARLAGSCGFTSEALEACLTALGADNCNIEAYLCGMEVAIALKRPDEALRLFAQGSKALKKNLGVEPTIEMLRLNLQAKAFV